MIEPPVRVGISRALRAACVILSILLVPGAGRATITVGPYVLSVGGDSAVIVWQTAESQRGRVVYGTGVEYGRAANHVGLSRNHAIRLSHLEPDTLIHYRVVTGADTSSDATFHTPTRPGRAFRFLAYGDDRSGHGPHRDLVKEMLKADNPPPALLLNTGDMTSGGSEADYRVFFDIESPLLRRAPLYPCVGNHDMGDTLAYRRHFPLPTGRRWYTVRYGNAAFHMLDCYSDQGPGSRQRGWLLSELRADSADPSIRHVIVSFHSPPYTTNKAHPSDATVREWICPLLERFHVALTFQGHNHCYEHSLVKGVHYVVTGGGGAPLYDEWGPREPWTLARDSAYEFVQVDVRGDTLAVKTIRTGGAVIDSFTVVERR